MFCTRTGQHIMPSKLFFKKIRGYSFNQAGRTQYCLEERMQNANKSLVKGCEDLQKQSRAVEGEMQENGGAPP